MVTTSILIYLAILFFVNIKGRFANELNMMFVKFNGEQADEPRWKLLFGEYFFRLLVIPFFPISFLVVTLLQWTDKVRRNLKYGRWQKQREKEGGLRFQYDLAGVGVIHCKGCSYQQDIISFKHGFCADQWNITGFQCQGCGKFHEKERSRDKLYSKRCECGGWLSRDEVIFCPRCKGRELRYELGYIT